MTEYSIVRSKRKTIALNIKDGKLIVKAPLKILPERIEAFIIEKEKWINRKLKEGIEHKSRFDDILSFNAFLYLGNRLPYCMHTKKFFAINGNILFIPEKFYDNERKLLCDSHFQESLKRFYKKSAIALLFERIKEIAYNVDINFSTVSLTNAKTKWGSCDSSNNIRLNWRLILLPIGLIDYVIIHELAHTVKHDHSREFWMLVSELYPEYKEAIKCMKEVGILTEYLY